LERDEFCDESSSDSEDAREERLESTVFHEFLIEVEDDVEDVVLLIEEIDELTWALFRKALGPIGFWVLVTVEAVSLLDLRRRSPFLVSTEDEEDEEVEEETVEVALFECFSANESNGAQGCILDAKSTEINEEVNVFSVVVKKSDSIAWRKEAGKDSKWLVSPKKTTWRKVKKYA
jgi:hypothetical protein